MTDPIYDVDDERALNDLEELLDLMAIHQPLYSHPDVNRLAKHARRHLDAVRRLRAATR